MKTSIAVCPAGSNHRYRGSVIVMYWTLSSRTMFRACVTLKFPRDADMPARVSEAIVLRTYPLKEADLIVSFLTRDCGKLRGVAKRARRPKGGFGASLERLAHGKMFYFQRETRELVT